MKDQFKRLSEEVRARNYSKKEDNLEAPFTLRSKDYSRNPHKSLSKAEN
jgi:hypothetical protein